MKLHPDHAELRLTLAEIETLGGHLEKAESVLREPDLATASPELVVKLADVLIDENKIEGTDQAEGYIARLREAGFGDTLVRYLEGRILYQRRQWSEAIPGSRRLATAQIASPV